MSKVRADEGNSQLFEHFEWLAATLVRLHPQLAFNAEFLARTIDRRVASTEDDLRDLVAMRSPIGPRPPVASENAHR